MNIGKMLFVVDRIYAHYTDNNFISLFDGVMSSLRTVVSQASQATSDNFTQSLRNLYIFLENDEKTNSSLMRSVVLQDMGFFNRVGIELKNRIVEVLDKRLPGIVLQDLGNIYNEEVAFLELLKNLLENFSQTHFKKDELEGGEIEINIVYPVDVVNMQVTDIDKELRDIDWIVRTSAELVGCDVSGYHVSSIGASRLMVNIKTSAQVVAYLAASVTFALNSYNSVLDIKLKRFELEKIGVSRELLEQMDKEPEIKLRKAMDNFSNDAVAKYLDSKDGLDDGRKKELALSVSKMTEKLYQKIEKGVELDFVVNQGESSLSAVEEEVSSSVCRGESALLLEEISNASRQINSIKSAGRSALEIEAYETPGVD